MSVGYRAILTMPAKTDAVERVGEQLYSWLRDRRRSGNAIIRSPTAHGSPLQADHVDQFAPRVYYFDDVERSAKLYIGYVGRHLINTKTN